MKTIIYYLIITFSIIFPLKSLAHEIVPIVRDGSCPMGYVTSGNYCIPNQNATYTIKRIGSCPSGYITSGSYCVAGSKDAKLAIIKIGNCPTGYHTSGKYCLQN